MWSESLAGQDFYKKHIPERAPTILRSLSLLRQPQSQGQGLSAIMPGFVRGWCAVLGIPEAPPDTGTASAPEPLLQELNIPSALVCVSWGHASSQRELP